MFLLNLRHLSLLRAPVMLVISDFDLGVLNYLNLLPFLHVFVCFLSFLLFLFLVVSGLLSVDHNMFGASVWF